MSIKPDGFIAEKNALFLLKPSARKSLGEYKPLLIHPKGGVKKTEVLAQAASHNIDGNRTYERGRVFKTMEEAVSYAESIRQLRIDHCVARAKKYGFDI